MREIDLTGQSFEDEEPWRWSRPAMGIPPLTPDEYYKLGRLSAALPLAARQLDLANSDDAIDQILAGLDASPEERAALAEALAETEAEEQLVDYWTETDDPELQALMDEMSQTSASMQRRADDYANLQHQAIDLSNGMDRAEEQQNYDQRIKRLARTLAREQYSRDKDFGMLASAFAEVGVEGTPIDLANRPGTDASMGIELGRYTGEFPQLCGRADLYGRCSERFHDLGCSHVIEHEPSYGASPKASLAYREAVQRRAGLPLADADGRTWRTSDGRHATAADHFEAQSGVRTRRSSPFEPGPDGRRDPAVIEPRQEFPAATRATAAAIIAQGMPWAAPRDAQRERDKARTDPGRQAVKDLTRQALPDHRWTEYRERAAAQAEARQRQAVPVSLSNAASSDPDDLYGPLCGSLGQIAPR